MTYAEKQANKRCWVSLDSPHFSSGRCGTVISTQDELIKHFGAFQDVQCADEKVTKRWVFVTPRGYAEVRDYWWNAHTEWSIVAENHKATQWVTRWLRSHDVIAGSYNSLRHLTDDMKSRIKSHLEKA